MALAGVLAVVAAYVLLISRVSRHAERSARGRAWTQSPVVVALGLTVYCTTWTYYGSVGKAASGGFGYLPVYLGPTLALLLGSGLYRRVIERARSTGATSIADFVAARYGRSELVAGMVTVVLVIGLIPYIGLQLGALAKTFSLLTGDSHGDLFALGVGLCLAFFAARYGMSSLDSTRHSPGLVAGVAVEAVIKLGAFVVAALVVSRAAFDGPADFLDQLDQAAKSIPGLGAQDPAGVLTWVTVGLLSASAFVFLPRQFHMGVIQCPSPAHVRTSRWLVPAYLFAINLLVLPLALGATRVLGPKSSLDTLVLSAPLALGGPALAIAVFVGGLSAAAGMITVETTAMATMVTNHVLMPGLRRVRRTRFGLEGLLSVRRAVGGALVLGGFGFHALVGSSQMMVSIGLISFAATFILAPIVLAGLFDARPTRGGAIAALGAGGATWAYTLLLPAIVRSGWMPAELVAEGPGGIGFLRPEALLGWEGLPGLAHGVLWTTALTVLGLYLGSLLFPAADRETRATERFLDPDQGERELVLGAALSGEEMRKRVRDMLTDLFEPSAVDVTVQRVFMRAGVDPSAPIGPRTILALHRALERELAGALGAAMAHGIVSTRGLDLDVVDARALAQSYGEQLVALRLSPEELAERVDYHRDRQQLLDEQFENLMAKIRERDREIAERQRAENLLERARDELELRVDARTRELAERNAELRLILDNARQGFVTVDATGRMSTERSRILASWLNIQDDETSFVDAVARVDEETGAWLGAAFETLADPLVPVEPALSQLPTELRAGSIDLTFDYFPVEAHDDRALVVLSDVTAERERERSESGQAELLDLIEQALADPEGTRAFAREIDELFGHARSALEEDSPLTHRYLHTLKGNARMHGLGALAEALHELESACAKGRVTSRQLDRVEASWATTRDRVSRLLEGLSKSSAAEERAVDALIEGVESGAPLETLRGLAHELSTRTVGLRLERLGEEARRLAGQLGRPIPDVTIEGGDTPLVDEAGGVWSALVHAVRNAVDHGLEPAEERAERGKPERGRVRIAAGASETGWWVEVEDDGRGIDVDGLRSRLGSDAATADVLERVFQDGLSSRRDVTELSGRGVGLAALREEVERLGGRCLVDTQPGAGTQMRFEVPHASPAEGEEAVMSA